MAQLVWQEDLNTEIELIDHQHRRIVDLVNQLQARNGTEVQTIAQRIDELIDYTQAHFSFEESLMEESTYPFRHAHTRVHEIISARMEDYRQRCHAGEEVSEALCVLFERWLFNHIRGDDKAYADAVKRHVAPFIVARKRSHALNRGFRKPWQKPTSARTEPRWSTCAQQSAG
jgi:hemerythrin